MNVNLLYSHKDRTSAKPYFDWYGMVKDLGLDALFDAAKKDAILGNSRVVYSEHEDPFLAQTMKKVMCVPLDKKEDVLYRQEILKDCLRHEDFVGELYVLTSKVLTDWEKLGRKRNHTGVQDTKAELITDIQVLRLLVSGMSDVKNLLFENLGGLSSRGFQALYERIHQEFSQDAQESLEKILQALSFYTDTSVKQTERNVFTSNRPRIQIDCGIANGLKFGDMKLEGMETVVKAFTNPYGIMSKLQGQLNGRLSNYISLYKNTSLQEDAANLEYQAVSYVMSCCGGVLSSFGYFFDQLHFQIGFYLGAINIKHQMKRYLLDYCFPEVGERDSLHYEELKEVVMSMAQGGKTVGNTGNLDGKMLAIITGANQGGKSTFLRSVGIAQVMMQCGMMVAAKRFCSGLYPNFFTHFTRREDSAMNSGRLDEELRRMDQIIRNLGKDSLIILNESFATTTEKEGSAIAYDVIKALKEENVKILTVTHLLSFAQKMYDETGDVEKSDVAFLSAEHLEDGTRTFRMIPHEPEQTSFGLELFEKIIEKHR